MVTHSLDQAVQVLKRDPTKVVHARIDDDLTVEVRAIRDTAEQPPRKSAADVFREIGRWEGETGRALDDLFADIRQRSNRRVPDLP